jgi:hypothetical protein
VGRKSGLTGGSPTLGARIWAAFQGAIVAALGPVAVATFGFLTWSNTRWDGVPDNAPKRACALILFVSPALVVVATIYVFVASAAVRWLRIRAFGHGPRAR